MWYIVSTYSYKSISHLASKITMISEQGESHRSFGPDQGTGWKRCSPRGDGKFWVNYMDFDREIIGIYRDIMRIDRGSG